MVAIEQEYRIQYAEDDSDERLATGISKKNDTSSVEFARENNKPDGVHKNSRVPINVNKNDVISTSMTTVTNPNHITTADVSDPCLSKSSLSSILIAKASSKGICIGPVTIVPDMSTIINDEAPSLQHTNFCECCALSCIHTIDAKTENVINNVEINLVDTILYKHKNKIIGCTNSSLIISSTEPNTVVSEQSNTCSSSSSTCSTGADEESKSLVHTDETLDSLKINHEHLVERTHETITLEQLTITSILSNVKDINEISTSCEQHNNTPMKINLSFLERRNANSTTHSVVESTSDIPIQNRIVNTEENDFETSNSHINTTAQKTETSQNPSQTSPSRRSNRSRNITAQPTSTNSGASNLPVPKSYTTNCGNGHHCIIHKPTLEELESLNSFGTYIREVVLPAANAYEIDKDHPEFSNEFYMNTKMELSEGMALIRLPEKFGCSRASSDRTGRGPEWQPNTVLGDWIVQSPIEQFVTGMAGVYEYTFVDKPAMTISQFRERADKYKQDQIGHFIQRATSKKKEELNIHKSSENIEKSVEDEKVAVDTTKNIDDINVEEQQLNEKYSKEDIEILERQFWKRLGPTMIPALYGADQEDSLFYPETEIDKTDPAKCNTTSLWSLSQLDSCLQVLPPIPGVTSPYLYVGMWSSVFCAHTEDMNLLSINYLHAGSPKLWYSIAEPDAARFLSLAEHYYARCAKKCKEFLRHKRYLLSPAIIQKAGIKFQTAIQYPGDAVITMPGGYHFGFNIGFNVAEATNFGVPEWIPFGKLAKVCLCRPDSVRIDMHKLTLLIQRFQKDQKRNRRLTFLQWRRKRDWEKKRHGGEDNTNKGGIESTKRKRNKKNDVGLKRQKLSDQQRINEFWVEVLKPVSSDGKIGQKQSKVKRRRSSTKNGTGTTGRARPSASVNKNVEIWHLAKPINKSSNRITLNSRVLCIIPASQSLQLNLNAISNNKKSKNNEVDNDDDDEAYDDNELEEQCFAGQVVEMQDNFVRIHLNGLQKTDDIWMPITSSRLFLDGGQWNDTMTETNVPPLHYWQEMDSKKRLST